MKIQIPKQAEKLQPLIRFIKRYMVFIFVTTMLLILAFFVFRINQYSNIEPAEDAFSDRLKTVQRPKIDQAVVDKILQLKSQNIEVQSLFEQARNNPFSE